MHEKAFKVLVEIKFRAVSCPGVHLSIKDGLYLSVYVMGQYRPSECLPAAFPLQLHEKMTFEKIFRNVVDPAEVARMLEYESVRIDLIQSSPPDGDILACFEENARRFLFPEPKLVRPFSGVDQEVLMTRAPFFPGIAPRLEFSTKTSITECAPESAVKTYPNILLRPYAKRSRWHCRRQTASSPQRKQQRGRRSCSARCASPCRPRSLSPVRNRCSRHLDHIRADRGSPRTSFRAVEELPVGDSRPLVINECWDNYHTPLARPCRSESSSHEIWEEVEDRVRSLLTTPKAVRRLTYGVTDFEADAVLARRSISPCPP